MHSKLSFVVLITLTLGTLYVITARPLFYHHATNTTPSLQAPQHVIKQLHHYSLKKPIHGIDLSHYQTNVNWKTLSKTPIRFVYLKATDGITYTDPLFHKRAKDLQNYHFESGAYHFFEADDDPQKQAQHFLETISQYPFTLTPMVDVEVTDQQSPETLQKRLKIWLDAVEHATGCRPLIYSYGSFWESNIGSSFNTYPFWLADYQPTPHLPKGMTSWSIWQYTDKGHIDGISGSVDIDVLIKGEETLKALRCQPTKGAK